MSLSIGIVGLPNVGKSTIFNALTKSHAAQVANYPFCTIDANIGIVEVPDPRLKSLAEISNSEKIIPAVIKFADIAGLVKGASKGDGLGNKFLSHIRECDAIAHIVRLFEDPNITHVHGKINPKEDREVIESELLLADMQTMEKRMEKALSDAKSGNKEKNDYYKLLKKIHENLSSGILANLIDLSEEEKEKIKDLHLLTFKPLLYIINIPESEIKNIDIEKYAQILGIPDKELIIPICAKIEEELLGFSENEILDYLKELGIQTRGLDNLIRKSYEILGLITFFTSGPKETRAWAIKRYTLAPASAGTIHTDFEKGFIKAEVVNWEKLVNAGAEIKARELGLIRLEGKDYITQDGDVMHFKFAV